MTKLLLIRHGHSLSNETGRFTGQLDWDLSDIGWKQAALLAAYLEKDHPPDCIYTSDLCRAVHTITPYTDKHPALPVYKMKELREIHGGVWQGMTAAEIQAAYPEAYHIWKHNIGLAHPTGGESVADLSIRAAVTIQEILSQNRGHTVLVVTHAVVIRSLLCRYQNLPPEDMHRIAYVRNASVTEVLVDETNGVSIPQIGYDKHLTGLETSLSAGF